MVSALFQPEVDTLQLHISQLQSQIATAEARVKALGECELTAAGAVQMLQDAVNKITGLAPDAITTLKASVLNLFNSGDGGSQVEQPVNPAPLTPDDTNREQHDVRQVVVLPSPEPSAVMEVSDALSAGGTEQLVAVVIEPEHLHGQSCLLEHCPPESLKGQTVEIACQMEDCPESALVGQSYELACWYAPVKPLELTHRGNGYEEWTAVEAPQAIAETAINEQVSIEPVGIIAEAQSLFGLVELTPSVAYMKRSDTGEILCGYLGGSNKQTLKAWGEWLCIVHSVGTIFELRAAQRLTQFKHELKIWGLSLTQIQRLAESDTTKRPPSNFGTAPKREAQRVPSDLEIADYKAGDVVRSATVRNWSYTILAVTSDGLLEVEHIGINPAIKSTLSPASVELVRRGGVVEVVSQEVAEHLEQQALDSIQPLLHPPARIDVGDVPTGVRLLHGRDDLLTQFEVLMTVEARVMGRIQRQQKQIGILTEVSGGVDALRPRASIGKVFGRTLDAVAYLIAGSGYKPLPTVKEPVLIGAVSVDDDDF